MKINRKFLAIAGATLLLFVRQAVALIYTEILVKVEEVSEVKNYSKTKKRNKSYMGERPMTSKGAARRKGKLSAVS